MVASSALTALYPGSFDPFHNGHLDVVEQSVELFGAVVIAVIAVRVMQVTIDKVVDMIAVGYRFVATAWAMNMI